MVFSLQVFGGDTGEGLGKSGKWGFLERDSAWLSVFSEKQAAPENSDFSGREVSFYILKIIFLGEADQIPEFSVFLVSLITRLTMKKLLLITFLLLLKVGAMNAQCPSGESEVVVLIQPDSYPGETSWDLRDLNGNIFLVINDSKRCCKR